MLRLDLARLEREGKLPVEGPLETEGEGWGDLPPRFDGELSATGTAESMPGSSVLVRAHLNGTWVGECPRCLEEVRRAVDEEVALYFASDAKEDDGEVRPMPEGLQELDLEAVFREELVLALPSYVLCRPECAGLCAKCGASLNDGPCGCSTREIDPRWAALDPNKG